MINEHFFCLFVTLSSVTFLFFLYILYFIQLNFSNTNRIILFHIFCIIKTLFVLEVFLFSHISHLCINDNRTYQTTGKHTLKLLKVTYLADLLHPHVHLIRWFSHKVVLPINIFPTLIHPFNPYTEYIFKSFMIEIFVQTCT